MKLPKCSCQSTMAKIQVTATGKLELDTFGLAEFNGTSSELLYMMTAQKSSLTTVNLQVVNRQQTTVSGGKIKGGLTQKSHRLESLHH